MIYCYNINEFLKPKMGDVVAFNKYDSIYIGVYAAVTKCNYKVIDEFGELSLVSKIPIPVDESKLKAVIKEKIRKARTFLK